MDGSAFRGLDKILYTIMFLILIAAGCNGYLIGRCHVQVSSKTDSGQSSDPR